MAEPLKSFLDGRRVRRIAEIFSKTWPCFPADRFVAEASDGLSGMELLDRGRHIAAALARALPRDFERAVDILLASLEHAPPREDGGSVAFLYMPHLMFVSDQGLDHFEASMRALHGLTHRFTGEFAIRFFLQKDPERTLARLRRWAKDESAHVRRLVSEGTRPRLPWAMRLPAFIKDPKPVLELLELLKDDPEEMVRRSVANNVGDIAKDHPELAVEVCRRWSEEAGEGRAWTIKHALRWLVKKGHPGALALMGAGEKAMARIDPETISISPKRASLGDMVTFSFEIAARAKKIERLVVDYVVHYPGVKGKPRPKVFKLRKVELAPGSRLRLGGKISLVDLTTRKHHPGEHRVDVRINGVDTQIGAFEVRVR